MQYFDQSLAEQTFAATGSSLRQEVDAAVPRLPGYAQDFWVDSQRYGDRAWPDLIELWSSYNRHLAHVITLIAEAKGNVRCRIGDGAPVTLRYVAIDYVGHVQHHLRQILQQQ